MFVTGTTGTGKTVTVQNLLSSLEPPHEEGGQNVISMVVNFSAQTSSLVTQVSRHSGWKPPGGFHLLSRSIFFRVASRHFENAECLGIRSECFEAEY